MCKLKSFALHPKLTQHCKSIFNRHFRKLKKKMNAKTIVGIKCTKN